MTITPDPYGSTPQEYTHNQQETEAGTESHAAIIEQNLGGDGEEQRTDIAGEQGTRVENFPDQDRRSDEHFAIVTRGLRKQFEQKMAVNDLNLSVRKGEFFGFLGPNGAGKSTSIKMMVGLLRPSAGQVWVGDIDVWQQPLQARALMGVLPEYLNLYERLTGREFIIFSGHMYGVAEADIQRRTEEMLSVLDLVNDADKMIVDYSVGMRKKVALAAAIIHRPQVLFLDEPFEGIDPVSSKVIRDILQELTHRGTTIFFSSHIMEVVERLCTRVGIINQGVLVAEGSLQELRERATGDHKNKDATLEDIFLNIIGVQNENHNLSWLE